jgi:2-polyprenyl-3-methyl-5-hydroxy-6-metoxy-1,4-benzoquinol methylase
MLICPDCHLKLPALGDCRACGWMKEVIDGVPSLLSTADRSSPISKAYFANYEQIADDDLKESIQPQDGLVAQAKSLFSYLGSVKGLHVCELGVGQGMLFDRLLSAGSAAVTGVDISLEYLRPYSSTGRVVVANAENLPFDQEFDLIVASEILEHVLNIGDTLISLHRSLVDGGRVVVRVPFKEDLQQYARQRECSYQFVHLRSFTSDSLVSLMGHAGFRLRRLSYDGCYEYRMKPWARRLAAPALRRYLARVYAGDVRARKLDSMLARLLFQPVTLTAIFEKAPAQPLRSQRGK